jgi:hypothetical protein
MMVDVGVAKPCSSSTDCGPTDAVACAPQAKFARRTIGICTAQLLTLRNVVNRDFKAE